MKNFFINTIRTHRQDWLVVKTMSFQNPKTILMKQIRKVLLTSMMIGFVLEGALLPTAQSSFLISNRPKAFKDGERIALSGVPLLVGDQRPSSSESSLTITDSNITSAIKKALQDKGVSVQNLEIETIKGIVKLAGEVSNLLEKEHAVKIAEMFKGVRAVVDQTRVHQSREFSDETIQDNMYEALKVDPLTKDQSVTVKVTKGRVRLDGAVPDWQTQYLVEQVAKGVKGVTALENNLHIETTPLQGDEEIHAAIQKRLQSDVWIDDERIEVQVEDRQVTLSGAVRSAAEKTRVKGYAWSLGVQAVDDEALRVRWEDKKPLQRDPAQMKPTDEDLKAAIADAFLFDPRVLSKNPEVRVKNGVVTLTGVARNLQEKEAAEEDVRNTPGVSDVKNLMTIHAHEMEDDRELAKQIRKGLVRDPYVEMFGLDVEVKDKTAILKGEVDTPFQHWHVRQLVASFPGIDKIVNNITIANPKQAMKDQDLVLKIKERLWWNPNIESYQIVVMGNNSNITLTGTADSWAERSLAEKIAYEAGATHVENDIQLRQASDFKPKPEM